MKKISFAMLVLVMLCSCSGSFHKEKWAEEPESRKGMVNSMLSQYELEGMTATEIIDLLGEPEQRLEEPSVQFVYYLGSAGLGVDDSLLRLYFNRDGQLERHEITHD
ncbi:hypothetical protein D3P08_16030 [Paenibacillus nanensis]|uniref:Outer membrane protein assembly factor BamE n=1 Tax=Paenibacillus nanensis TaxID=393251 RepID=A0A3A1USG0_9BACL|nr:hypothetical protein [Paenibacillus nanensis]RIX51427.1 hypothetical protein D3P08_16030 [Paenibacillus nanensis]